MRKMLAIFAIIFLVALSISALWMASNFNSITDSSQQRSFTVSGEGKVAIVPDIGSFTFGVISDGSSDLAKLQKDNTERSNKVIEYLKEQGVEKEDIKTQSYNVDPQNEYYPCTSRGSCPPPKIVGYTIRQIVLVKIRDLDQSGDIISGVVASGANNVSQLSFTVDDMEKVKNEARALAIKQAKEKAQGMAKAGGFSLGKLLSINDNNYSGIEYPYAVKDQAGGMGGETMASSPTIEPGETEVTVTVSMTYAIR